MSYINFLLKSKLYQYFAADLCENHCSVQFMNNSGQSLKNSIIILIKMDCSRNYLKIGKEKLKICFISIQKEFHFHFLDPNRMITCIRDLYICLIHYANKSSKLRGINPFEMLKNYGKDIQIIRNLPCVRTAINQRAKNQKL